MDEPKKDVLQPTDAEAIRLGKTLLRSARHASLAVAEAATGWPLASRVSLATDMAGRPLILVSTLAAHTAGLVANERCSLLVGEPGRGDPLAHPRMTIKCRARKSDRDAAERAEHARRFLNRHPKAKLYSDFGDFSYFRLEPEEASLNGGFGKAFRLMPTDILSDLEVAAALEAVEQGAIDHMNADHRDALALCARHFAGVAEALDWTMTGIDPDGFDLRAGQTTARLLFPSPLASKDALRPAFVEMTRRARAAQTAS